MKPLPLRLEGGHLFVELEGAWLLDTGSPASFGVRSSLSVGALTAPLARAFGSLTPAALSRFVGVECAGLWGVDLLGRFDWIIDTLRCEAIVSPDALAVTGSACGLDLLEGVPIVVATIGGRKHRMLLDTGAQLSYFRHPSFPGFPPAGPFADFHPALGAFETETRTVDAEIGEQRFQLRCGELPAFFRDTLAAAGADGIVGSELFASRRAGYFPRRRLLVL